MSFFGFGKKADPVINTPVATPSATSQPADAANQPAANEAAASPMDQYKDLWQPAPTDPNAKPEPDLFAVDPEQLGQAASKLDFAKVIKPDQLAAIARGGDDAVAAFGAAMNAVAQATWQSNFATSTQLMKDAFAKKELELETRIQGALKNQGIDAALASNPVFNHPAAKPVVGAIARAMSSKFPEASPQELQAKAAELLAEMAGSTVTSDKVKQEAATSNNFTDWDDWLRK